MHRYVAVQVQHPRIEYAGLLKLDRPNRHARQLVTLREGQQEAVVEVALVEKKKGEPPRRLRRLHSFYLKELPARSAGRTQITLDASYDGRSRARVRVSVAGRLQQEVALSVPRERRRLIWPVMVAVLLLVVGGLWVLRTGPIGGDETGKISARIEPAEAEETESAEEQLDREPAGAVVAPERSEGVEDDQIARIEPSEDPGALVKERSFEAEPPPEREFVVYFEPNETDLTAGARAELANVAALLRELPDARVRIVGHTALFGTEEGRREISRGRAEEVYRFLRQQGWEPEREAVVAWEASTDPVTRDRGQQRLNRRVEIEVGVQESP